MAAGALRAFAPSDFSQLRETVERIDAAARAADGHPALGEAVWRDLERPGADSAAFLTGDALIHVARSDTFSPQHWLLGLVVHPDARDTDVVHDLVERAAAHVAGHGGGRLVLWNIDATAADDAALAQHGLLPARDLYEMRVPLPLDESPRWPPGITVRPFEPGQDDAAWLEVNNRAFANHAEQGGWIEATLHRRMAEPWFDPSIFVLAFDAEGLAGFNWCKVHEAHGRDPALGEIFVIGVDPRAAGSGIGRALAVEGLARMHARGIDTGMLFCAADNTRALALYRSLGFTVHRVDRAYERTVDPA